jgi:membrane dipeptidase
VSNSADSIHKDALVIDAVAPLLNRHDQLDEYLDMYIKGGVTAVAPSVGGFYNALTSFKDIAGFLHHIPKRGDVFIVKTAADIERAKREGKLGLIFHFQGTEPFDDDLNLVDAYHALGVRMVQLTYNVKNRVGDGCDERTDAGLSNFGVKLIERLNAKGIVVDCAHTGYRTSMEAAEVSAHPVVLSHANARNVFESKRNVGDDLARTIARTGGVVGVNAVSFFLRMDARPDIEDVLDHIDHFVTLLGIDHVGIGLDFWWGQPPFVGEAEADAMWRKYTAAGVWKEETYPRKAQAYPTRLATPAEIPNITHGLIARGYGAEDCKKIIGGNWLRVFRQVWGG